MWINLRLLNFLAVSWLSFQAESVNSATSDPTTPNIVVIVGDDQHWKDYGFMGHPKVKTPNLDRLASDSMLFPKAYVPSSLCSPSLASIISGLYPHQHRITSNDPVGGNKTKKLRDPDFVAGRERYNQFMSELPTLPRLLTSKGYLSFQTGKWWQGSYATGGFTHGMTEGSRHGDKGLEIGRKGNRPVVEFLDEVEKQDKPFFLWYAPFMPHTPHNAPKEYEDKYITLAPNVETAKYWAMIDWFDDTCGKLLQILEKRRLSENTIVVFVCDNGFLPSADRFDPRTKQSPYEGGIRTPLMIRWPSQVKPSVRSDLASSIDIAPTLLAAVGLDRTNEMQGVNLLDNQELQTRKAVFGEIFTHDSQDFEKPSASLRWRWVISGSDKLIIPETANEPSARIELYDLESDPEESRNLAPSQREKVETLQKQLDQWWKP